MPCPRLLENRSHPVQRFFSFDSFFCTVMLPMSRLTAVAIGRKSMIRTSAAIAAALVTATIAFAQTTPPTYQADPSVYKVIFEDQNFRVIAATWKKGTRDKDHAHPSPSIGYAVTDCSLTDGKSRDVNSKAGT